VDGEVPIQFPSLNELEFRVGNMNRLCRVVSTRNSRSTASGIAAVAAYARQVRGRMMAKRLTTTVLTTTALLAIGCATSLSQTTPENGTAPLQGAPAGPAGVPPIPERVEPGPGAAPTQQPLAGQVKTEAGGSVKLSEDQRAKIKQMVQDRSARVDNANFAVTVGSVVPKTVHMTVVPPDIIAAIPEFRGFDYVLIGNNILIVNPDTFRIVAVVPA
jgi:hypothetical protein